MKEITANGTAFQIQKHTEPAVDANGKFTLGFSSAGDPFPGGASGLSITKLTALYLNGEKIEVTDGMYSTLDHWLIYIQLDPAKIQDTNEIVFSIVPTDLENTNCNFDNYFGIYTFAKPQ